MSFEADSLTGFFALQDVRGWGAEGDTLKDFDANGLDLHEGFLSWTTTESLSLKVGRQEIAMQEHRLIGTVGWAQQARSFDAARASGSLGVLQYDLVGAVLADHAGEEEDAPHVYGDMEIVRIGWLGGEGGQVEALGIRDTHSTTQTDRMTAGVFAKGASGIWSGRLEAYVQSNEGLAHMVGVQGTVKPELGGNPSLTLWFDRLSSATTDAPAFNTLFATNHKYYGTADLAVFELGGPSDGSGLHDLALKIGVNPTESWRVQLDGHHFTTSDSEMRALGQELDITGKRGLAEGLALAVGASVLRYSDDSPTHLWSWLQLDASF